MHQQLFNYSHLFSSFNTFPEASTGYKDQVNVDTEDEEVAALKLLASRKFVTPTTATDDSSNPSPVATVSDQEVLVPDALDSSAPDSSTVLEIVQSPKSSPQPAETVSSESEPENLTNLDSRLQVPVIASTRTSKNHPIENIIGPADA